MSRSPKALTGPGKLLMGMKYGDPYFDCTQQYDVKYANDYNKSLLDNEVRELSSLV